MFVLSLKSVEIYCVIIINFVFVIIVRTGLSLKVIKCDLHKRQLLLSVKSVMNLIVKVTRVLFCSSCWRLVLCRCPHQEPARVPVPQLLFATSLTCSALVLILKRAASRKSAKKPGNYFSAAMIQSYPLQERKRGTNGQHGKRNGISPEGRHRVWTVPVWCAGLWVLRCWKISEAFQDCD